MLTSEVTELALEYAQQLVNYNHALMTRAAYINVQEGNRIEREAYYTLCDMQDKLNRATAQIAATL